MPLLFNGKLVEVNYTIPHPEIAIEVADDAELDPGSLPDRPRQRIPRREPELCRWLAR